MDETFNAYIIHARTKHLISMLEDIRTSLMHRIVVKNKEATKWAETSTICPRIVKNLEKEKDLAANCNPLPSTLTVFQVTYGIDVLTVDLKNGSCTCRKWDVTGIPCCHAISCIFFMHEEAEEYVHDQFKIDTHKLAYSGSISPCVGERYWPKIDHRMDPPPIKIGPGRPRKNRRRDPYESPSKPGKLSKHGSIMSCSVCKSTSHNKRKCPFKNNFVEPPPKRSVGRPRKSVEGSSSINAAAHHQTTAQPSRLGRGGRVIMTGRGNCRATSGRNSSSVAGGRDAASGQSIAGGNVRDEAATRRGGGSRQVAGRGGRDGRRGSSSGRRGGPRDSSLNRVLQGFGIFVDNHGNHISNEPRSSMGSRQSIRSQSEFIQN